MAGSYHHLRDDDTGLCRFDLIENLRDAYQACEQCFFLTDYLTGNDQSRIEEALADYYRGCRGEAMSAEGRAAFTRLRRG